MSSEQPTPESAPNKPDAPKPASAGITPPKAGMVNEAAKNKTAQIVLPGMDKIIPPRRPLQPLGAAKPTPQAGAPARPAPPGAAARPGLPLRQPPAAGAAQPPRPPQQPPAAGAEPTQAEQAPQAAPEPPSGAQPGQPPKTIQLKRPAGALRVPQAPAAQPDGTPRTIRLAKPATPPAVPISPAPARTLDEAAKNATARIVLDNVSGPPQTSAATIQAVTPPKPGMLHEAAKNRTARLVLSSQDTPESAAPAQKQQTGNVTIPSEIANADTVVAAARPPASKKSTTRVIDIGPTEPGKRATSRIILEGMEAPGAKRATAPIAPAAPAAPGAGPKTIRLKRPTGAITVPPEGAGAPPSTVRTIKLAKPGAAAAVPPTIVATPMPGTRKDTAPVAVDQEAPTLPPKSSTARITSESDEESQPETIRLRRPSTIMAVTPSGLQAPRTESVPKTETTRIELDTSTAKPPATQAKTLKVARPPQKPADAPEAEAGKSPEFRPADILGPGRRLKKDDEQGEPSMHVAFSILSVAAIIVLAMVAYLLAAQAFAPDFTLPIPAFLL